MPSRRNPHRSGEVFARAVVTESSTNQTREKPPPKWGGVCEYLRQFAGKGLEKPPPKWGGVCEGNGLRPVTADLRETPTEVGPPSLTTNCQGS